MMHCREQTAVGYETRKVKIWCAERVGAEHSSVSSLTFVPERSQPPYLFFKFHTQYCTTLQQKMRKTAVNSSAVGRRLCKKRRAVTEVTKVLNCGIHNTHNGKSSKGESNAQCPLAAALSIWTSMHVPAEGPDVPERVVVPLLHHKPRSHHRAHEVNQNV